ncbi:MULTISPECIES: hypothetical protein [Vagococcus]|uniref:Uncharacterized protein n=1 Tax=Vagococcus fluvialis bH819 TaxID=1255619 RepID=A0A1X6WQT5_9ENTE|nr:MULTISPECIES: hypothetical protein [Vagococcus]SLM86602.1 hypothetical protein FM121_10945 [Vagococcus fluvialis bH819]HCM90810.1 hypothetical protein [Vagococcus sp.]
MEETLFFNLGNALASNFDTKELERTAQVERLKWKRERKLVIVTDPEHPDKEKILFDLSDQETSSTNTIAFKVHKVIE